MKTITKNMAFAVAIVAILTIAACSSPTSGDPGTASVPTTFDGTWQAASFTPSGGSTLTFPVGNLAKVVITLQNGVFKQYEEHSSGTAKIHRTDKDLTFTVSGGSVTFSDGQVVSLSISGTTMSGTVTNAGGSPDAAVGDAFVYNKLTAYDTSGSADKALLAAPGGITVGSATASSLTVSWNTVTGAASYIVYRSATSTGTYSQVGTSATTSFLNSGLSASTTYYYKVATVDSDLGTGAKSAAGVSGTTTSGSGGGGGTPVFWYGRPFSATNGLELYKVVAGASNDVHKFAYTDFDYNTTGGTTESILYGEHFYYKRNTTNDWYEVVAGASNDTLFASYASVDAQASASNFGIIGGKLCYAVAGSGANAGKYDIYSVESGTDTQLYAASDFDSATGSYSTLKYSGGKVYYTNAAFTLYELAAGSDVAIMPYTDIDNHYTYNFVVSGGVACQQDMDGSGGFTYIDRIVAGSSNDVRLVDVTDCDGSIPTATVGGVVNYGTASSYPNYFNIYVDTQ